MSTPSPAGEQAEALLARLTEAAYRVALEHGLRGSFLEVELRLWRALRQVLAKGTEAQSCAR